MKHAIDQIPLSDISPDDRNANRGTERGAGMLEQSLRNYGAGRSILLDKNNLIAGNKTIEQAAQIGLDEVVVVDSDGSRLVAVRRTDIDLDSKAGRELAIADNRTSEVGLAWDVEALQALASEGVELDAFWFDNELDALLASVPTTDDWAGAMDALPDGDKSPYQQMTFTITNEQADCVRAALYAAKAQGTFSETGNENSNGNALHRVCATFIAGRAE